ARHVGAEEAGRSGRGELPDPKVTDPKGKELGRLEGKAAIVTGAGQGIGRGVARAFAREEAAVTIAEINPETGRAVARELEDELGATAMFVPTDVLQHADVHG